MATEMAENSVIEIPEEERNHLAQDLTCGALDDTLKYLKAYQEDGDLTPFKEKAVQENLYNTFCLADTMEKMAKAIKDSISNLCIDTARTDGEGKYISTFIGLKIKQGGSTTEITNPYVLVNKIALDDNLDIHTMLKACKISIKDLAKACGRSEDYLCRTYPNYIVKKEKKPSIVREF